MNNGLLLNTKFLVGIIRNRVSLFSLNIIISLSLGLSLSLSLSNPIHSQ